MLTLEVPLDEIPLLKYEKYHNPMLIVRKRSEIILLLSTQPSLRHQDVATIVDVHPNTISNVVKYYHKGGIKKLKEVNFKGTKSNLSAHTGTLEDYFFNNPVKSSKEAQQKIKTLTGLDKSLTQVRAWMHKAGMTYQKTAQVPAKACPQKQEAWLEDVFNPLLEQAKKQEITLLFGDAMHCVMGVFLCFLWSFTRVFVKSSPGRQRLNVIGVVNAISKQVNFLSNTSTVNAQTMVSFLQEIRKTYVVKPIYIILDNARYQHCNLVKEFAASLDIHLIFLPPYSPNLNIIERLWKWTKKKALYATYYEKFETFRAAIENTLKDANTKYQNELETLLTLNFQKL